jgi:hypothetical protein
MLRFLGRGYTVESVPAELARELERELADLKAQIEGLADRLDDPGKWYGGRVPSMLSEPARLLRSLLEAGSDA